jgi:hypothetical protein
MHTALDEGRWIVTRNCKEAISAIPTAIHDDKKLEDIVDTKDLAADVRDSLRYGLYSQYGPRKLSEEEQIRQEISHLSDPTDRAIHTQKRLADHDRAVRERGIVNNRSSSRALRWGRR